MADSFNRETLKIPIEAAKRLSDIQRKVWDETGKKPTLPEVLMLTLDCYERSRLALSYGNESTGTLDYIPSRTETEYTQALVKIAGIATEVLRLEEQVEVSRVHRPDSAEINRTTETVTGIGQGIKNLTGSKGVDPKAHPGRGKDGHSKSA